jgi:hypothetical protein
MEDDTIRSNRRLDRGLLPWTLRKLGAREAPANGADRPPEPLPAARAEAVDTAIARTRAIASRVRDQAFARYAFPWRFEEYPLVELAEPPTDAELEAWMQELDFRYQRAIEGEDEER